MILPVNSCLTFPLGLSSLSVLFGYVGPAGIGALGILLIVALVILIGAFGLLFYPIRIVLSHRRRMKAESDSENQKVEPKHHVEERI